MTSVDEVFSKGKYMQKATVEQSHTKWVQYNGVTPSPRPGAVRIPVYGSIAGVCDMIAALYCRVHETRSPCLCSTVHYQPEPRAEHHQLPSAA